MIETLYQKAKENHALTAEEIHQLLEYPLEELATKANQLRAEAHGDGIEVCSIISGKQGHCSENCRFCAQSAHNATAIETYELLPFSEIQAHYQRQDQAGISRSAIVTSGRKLSQKDLKTLAEYYQELEKEHQGKMRLCASHGLLSEADLALLQQSGVKRYHNNLETSKEYFPNICTSHHFEDKIATLKAAKKVGLELCSGGIFGLGESLEDRISMAMSLRELDVRSVPINILIPIKGTPLEERQPLSEDELVQSVALYRFILPKARLRLAGGRYFLADKGQRLLQSGADAVISGDMLTTHSCHIEDDRKRFQEMGRHIAPL